jgi:BioD-like phosphotransacetylase family protein
MLGAPVLMVAEGGVGNTIDTVTMNLSLYQQKGCDVRLLLANKLIPEKRTATLRYLGQAFAPVGLRVAGGFNWSPILANPTLQHISAALKLPLEGDRSQGSRIVHHIQLGAASTQRVADMLEDSTLLIVTSTRDELLVMMASLYGIPEYRSKIVGLIIPGYSPVSEITQKILDRSNIPYMRVAEPTSDVFLATKDHVSKITAQDLEKIRFIQELAEAELNFEAIDELFG